MRRTGWMAAGVIVAGCVPMAAFAQVAVTGDEGAGAAVRAGDAGAPDGDVVVIGKSYGREVGKTVTPLKDLPNTVTIVDREQIEAQNLFTLEDALTATNGVTVTGIGSEDPSFVSRGFTINNYLIDGVPTLSFGFPGVVPDLFFYDRLEVLRGPAGLFSGSGNPAGSINLVRKRPLKEARVQASAGYGSYANVRLELDASVPVGERAGIRVGAMAQDQDQFFDVAHRKRWGAYAVGSVALGERTTLTAGVYYDRFQPAIQSGLPGLVGGADGSEGRLLDIDRSAFLGADWNRFNSETRTGFVEATHRVSDRWTLRATGLVSNVDRLDVYSYIGNQPVTPANGGTTTHIAFVGDNTQRTRSFDVNGVGSFPLFGRDQTLILGADYQALDYTSLNGRANGYATINVFDPVSPREPAIPLTNGTRTGVEQYGLYGQTRITPLAGLTLVGGGRMTWWDTNITTLRATTPTLPLPTGYTYEGRVTPYAGVVWDVTRDWNLYASYADSFTPQAPPAGRARPDGGRIEPMVGQQFEAGTKLSLMNDRLLLSLAGYQIEQKNRLFNDPNEPTLVYQIGKVRARGIEAEATGEILPGWRVNGGYTYTRTKYLEEASPVLEGLPLVPIVPAHMVKLFTNYAPQGGVFEGASVGGSLTWFSETWGGNPAVFGANGAVTTRSTIVRQGSYAVVDLRAGYRLTERAQLSVNVANLLDRHYYARIASTGRGNYYGTPRTVFATLRFTYP